MSARPELPAARAGQRKPTGWLGPVVETPYPPDLCYLCEKAGADSEDHVIAQGFFGGITDELPRLRTHRECNSSYGKDEEYVRNSLVNFDAARGSGWEAASPKMLDALIPRFRTRRSQTKLMQQVRETRKESEHYLWQPDNVEHEMWQRALWKITRGLSFWHTGHLCPSPSDCPWGASMMRAWPDLEKWTYRFSNDAGFKVIGRVAGSEGRLHQGDLRLVFYEGVTVRVVFGMELGTPP